jgi:L-ascorbate metabolism protein UlaG (beta-lactamase superfamily)
MKSLNADVKLTWLGHASWLITTPGSKRIVIDPFLTDNPSCPEAYKGDGLTEIDLILVTHGHGDHIGDLVPLAKRTGAKVVAIFDLTTWLESKGVENVAGMNKGGTLLIDGLAITMTNAVHSSSYVDGHTVVDMGDPCGFVIEFENGFKLYNSGDTAVFGDMSLIGVLYSPDLAILPIGDYYTMGPREAAKAIELLGVKRVIPNHYGTFPVLTGTPEALEDLLPPDVELLVAQPGETIE